MASSTLKDKWDRRIWYPWLQSLGRLSRDYSPRRIDVQWPERPSRIDFLSALVRSQKFESYLEIGCRDDECFSQVPAAHKVGVDPCSGGTVRATSDEFFAGNSGTFDLIFIDGLHLADQVVRDIQNCLRFLNPGGVIVLHDCLPRDSVAQFRRRCSQIWNGDVWKALVEVRTWPRVDAAMCLIDQGLGIVTARPNTDPIPLPAKSFLELKYDQLVDDHRRLLRTLDYDEGLQFAVRAPDSAPASR